jgi:hypothetical protein
MVPDEHLNLGRYKENVIFAIYKKKITLQQQKLQY